MNILSIPIKDLHQDPSNARKHSAKNLAAIKGSLAKFGQQKPIVVDGNGVVLAGNGTLQAAIELGWEQIHVQRTTLTGTEAIAYAIADNRTSELAEWDIEVLGTTLEGLNAEGFDWESIGFDEDDFAKFTDFKVEGNEGNCDPDEVPEKVEPRTKPGDLYILGNHRLLCGDSTNVQHVERLMAGQKADMVFTDPPYGINNDSAKGATYNNNKAYDDSETFDLKLLQLWDCDWVIWGGNYYDWIPGKRTKIGWVVWDKRPTRETWDDDTRDAADRRFGQHFEIAITNIKGIRGKMIRKTWGGFYGTAGNKDDEIVHRTQKPIELIDHFITDDHKNILDYFLGSGSTLIACEKTGRRCFGMEIDPHYCDVIVTRFEKFSGKQATMEKNNE